MVKLAKKSQNTITDNRDSAFFANVPLHLAKTSHSSFEMTVRFQSASIYICK